MQDSKLHKWLSRLDKREQNTFVRYVEALGGKNRDELGRFAKLFVKKVVRSVKGMGREEFYFAMGWEPPYNAGYLHARLSDLKKKLETFLAYQEMRSDALAVAAYHMRATVRRGWADLAKAEIKQARDAVREAPICIERLAYGLQIEENYLNMAMELPRKFKEPSFQGLMWNLEELFCIQKLRYACAALNQDLTMNVKHDYGMLDDVLREVEARLPRSSWVLGMYFHAYKMLASPMQGVHFQTLRIELERHWKGMDDVLVNEFYKHLINHCINKINAGFSEFNGELAQIYDEVMASGAILVNGMLDPGQLKNMIAVMIRMKKLEVAEKLLETYGPKLMLDDATALVFNKAIICYHRGEFSATRKLMELVQQDAKDVFFKLEAKIYSMMASYELHDLDLSSDNYNALRMFLKRDKLLPAERRENYLVFISLLNRLWVIDQEAWTGMKRQRKLERLQASLATAPNTKNILWLREKVVAELNGGHT